MTDRHAGSRTAMLAAFLAVITAISASPGTAGELSVELLGQPVAIDGRLEPAWKEAAHFGGFHQYRPTDGRAAQVPTEGYIARDEEALLVAFVCHDPDIDALRASMSDRDQMLGDDIVGVILDTYQDHRQAYEFFSNAHGVQADLMWHADRAEGDDADAIWQANGGEDGSFEAVWESAGRVYEDRWVVEMRIPLSVLRYPSRADQSWSVHFVRVYPRENRYEQSWMPISQDSNSFMGQAGTATLHLNGGEGYQRKLELLPFITASRTDRMVNDGHGGGTWENQDNDYWDSSQRIGLTGKYAWSSDHVIDFAYSPDFSQIESDAGRIDVNSPFAFFYAERRPFFMEGKDVFLVDYVSSGMVLDVANLIYTRSINDPRLAGKATGRAGKLTYGYITAYDVNTPLVLPLADGTIVRSTTENSLSNIVRLKYDLENQSHIGFAATNRRFDMGGSNTAAALETALRLSDDFTLTAFGGMTYTDEPDDDDISQIIPDLSFEVGDETITADFDGQDFYGRVLKVTLLRQSRTLNFNMSVQDYTPGFRADNSAIFSNDGRLAHSLVNYNVLFEDHPLLTRIRPSAYIWRKVDHDGDLKDEGLRPEIQFSLAHQTTLHLGGFLFNKERYHNIEFDHARTLWGWVASQKYDKVSGWAYFNRGRAINRFGVPGSEHNPLELSSNFDFNLNLTLRPTDKINNFVSYRTTQLHTKDTDELIVRQQILRNTLRYQFSRQLFVRLVGELNRVRRALDVDDYQTTTTFSLEPMVSYKHNPFTVFYLGANVGGQEDPFAGEEGLTRTDQTVYMKFQYLWDAVL